MSTLFLRVFSTKQKQQCELTPHRTCSGAGLYQIHRLQSVVGCRAKPYPFCCPPTKLVGRWYWFLLYLKPPTLSVVIHLIIIFFSSYLFFFAEYPAACCGDEGERRTAVKPNQRLRVEGRSRVGIRLRSNFAFKIPCGLPQGASLYYKATPSNHCQIFLPRWWFMCVKQGRIVQK